MTPEQIEAVRQHLIAVYKPLYGCGIDTQARFCMLRGVVRSFCMQHVYDLVEAEDIFIPYIRFIIGDYEGLKIHGVPDDRVFSGAKGKA